MPREPKVSGRLDTWKAIAAYLGRNARTAIRWEKQNGLPIHRIPGGTRQAVFAYCHEIDNWMKSGRVPIEPEGSGPEGLTSPDQSFASSINVPSSAEVARASFFVDDANTLWSSLSPMNLGMLAKSFREAIDIDPTNAEAFAGLSFTYLAGGVMGVHEIPFAYFSARAAIARAVDLAPEHPEVLTAKAWLSLVLDKDQPRARRDFEAARALAPILPPIHIGIAMSHLITGESQNAFNILRDTLQHVPMNAPVISLLCWSAYLNGAYAKALSYIEDARLFGLSGPIVDAVEALSLIHSVELSQSIPRIEAIAAGSMRPQLLQGILGYALALSGERQRATEILEAITSSSPSDHHDSAYTPALAMIGLGNKKEAVSWLAKSYQKGSLWSFGYRCDPVLKPLYGEPAFEEFLSETYYPMPLDSLSN